MNLVNSVIQRNSRLPLFILPDKQINIFDILDAQRIYSGLLNVVAGNRIALCIQSVSTLAKLIILLDGVCLEITLMPRELSVDEIKKLLINSNVQGVISDYLTDEICPVQLIPLNESSGNLPLYEFETVWKLPTSGTTGAPKLISHKISSLSKTVKPVSDKGLSLCWGTFYDIGRFAGLQVYLQAVLGGSSLALTDNSEMSLSEIISALHAAGVNALSATPTMWQKILMTCGSECLNLKQITLGGEIVRQRVIDALSVRYPEARITHIYASTEFGVAFSITDRMEGFPSEWIDGDYSIGRIDIDSGELLLRKDNEWVATGDVVEEHSGRILFQGRLNGSINVGGNKVMPEEVEKILLQYPGVQMVSVTSQKSSFMGNLVQAEIMATLNTSQEEYRIDLIAYCRQHLDAYKVPMFIKFVNDISTSSTGKILRKGGNA